MAHFSFGINKKHSRSDFSQNPPFSSIMNVCQFGWVDFFFFFFLGGGGAGRAKKHVFGPHSKI